MTNPNQLEERVNKWFEDNWIPLKKDFTIPWDVMAIKDISEANKSILSLLNDEYRRGREDGYDEGYNNTPGTANRVPFPVSDEEVE